MNNTILTLKHINKKYGTKRILNDLNMNVCHKDIYGFVGENGSGKTTTLKLITGLTSCDSGEINIRNPKDKKLQGSLHHIGFLIDHPVMYPTMTAYQNLKTICLQKGVPCTDINETLDLVGLDPLSKKTTRNFSLGMKQRLGLAFTLVGNPDLIILDEPTNGLDPVGIIEFRKLIHQINTEKEVTFIISSHMLSELSQLGTTFGFLSNGSLIKELKKEDLLKEMKTNLYIRATTPLSLSEIINFLKEQKFTKIEQPSELELVIYPDSNDIDHLYHLINTTFKNNIVSMQPQLETLENFYIRTMNRNKVRR